MEILRKELIFLDQDIANMDDVFSFIANKAMEQHIITNADALIAGFKQREQEGSTGFEDGFAIPHARIKEAKTACVVVVRLKKGIGWNSIDGKPTNVAIALIVPDGQGNTHMEMLSDVATKLMNEAFKTQMKSATTPEDVIKAFSLKKAEPTKTAKKAADGLNILAITACVTGVAHTYLAEEKLIKAGTEMGHHVRVETHGSKGVGTPFSQKEINEADLIIFAVDTGVDKARFAGMKQYEVKVAKAIHDPQGLINDAQKKGVTSGNANGTNIEIKTRDNVMKHILAGVSYMIPVIVLGGICLAFSLGIAKAIWGPGATPDHVMSVWVTEDNKFEDVAQSPWGPLSVLNIIGVAAFTLMIPILAGFIGNSIAGRAAIAPAMVASFVGNDNTKLMPWPNIPGLDAIQTPMGFIGAILAGLAAGYLVKWINTWKIPRALQAAMPIFFIPLFVGLVLSLAFIYVLGSPIGWIMNKIQVGIEKAYGVTKIITDSKGKVTGAVINGQASAAVGLVIGLILGAMGGFDMGGPVNKIAFITCSILVTIPASSVGQDAANILQRPMGSLACAIPVAPLGMGLTSVIFPKFFDKDSKNMGVGAIIMGCIGISEGAIPFAIRDPKRAILCNVLGSAVAGAIGGVLGVQDAAAHGGPIVAALGAVPYGIQTLYFVIAAASGVAITCLCYGFWLLADAGKPGSLKERHVNYLADLKTSYLDQKSDLKVEISTAKLNGCEKVKISRNEGRDPSSELNDMKNEISQLQSQLTNLKSQYKSSVLKAKTAYKQLAPQEKRELKSQSAAIKTNRMDAKETYRSNMRKLISDASNISSFKNKEEKITYQNNLKNNKVSTKTSFQMALISDSTKRRESFVKQYNKAVA